MLRSEQLYKGMLLGSDKSMIRILELKDDKALVIDCVKATMPQWVGKEALTGYEIGSEEELRGRLGVVIPEMTEMGPKERRIAQERFTMIAGVLGCVGDKRTRCEMIRLAAEDAGVSKQKVVMYLCRYLIFQNIGALAPKRADQEKELTQDQKNMRWGLNKFYYTKRRVSLQNAYTQMLKAKYCDPEGKLLEKHPTFRQFEYFFKKYDTVEKSCITRNGLKDYQKNCRPLLGDGVQQCAPNVGMAMVDATVCDIYLVNDEGELVGRPILTAAVDGFSSLLVGYSLQWEGGMYSVRRLIRNILADKAEHCRTMGIPISREQWNSDKLPAVFITDEGSEYKSDDLAQLTELGVTVINLPSYRPELKRPVEKFFDLVQEEFKPYLKGKGVIEPDFQQRGARDYRKDACLTLEDFEKIVVRCILYYNSQRILEGYPFTAEMLSAGVKPYANSVYAWGCTQSSKNLIDVDCMTVMMTLLPRTIGGFSRRGLKVNRMRYKADGYTEQYLRGGEATVAYNPDDTSKVWLLENGKYVPFELIESRFRGMSVQQADDLIEAKGALIRGAADENRQARIDLASHIQTIAETAQQKREIVLRDIRENRIREQARTHVDVLKDTGAKKTTGGEKNVG